VYKHAWDEYFPDDLGPPPYGWRLSLRCLRCGAQRHDLIDTIGQLSQRRYIYPEGYHMTRDGMPSLADFRLQLFRDVRDQLAAARAITEQLMSVS
jgi:hypothetical protein